MRRWTIITVILAIIIFGSETMQARTFWLDELDLSKMKQGWGEVGRRRSVGGNPLRMGGHEYQRGIGTHAESVFIIRIAGQAARFQATIGVDDEVNDRGTVQFLVFGDKRELFNSGALKGEDEPKAIDLDVTGIDELALIVEPADFGITFDHADWADARLELEGDDPKALPIPEESAEILTPPAPKSPRINGARIYGVRPGSPFLYRIPATGERPMRFSAAGLPKGLELDPDTGVIAGRIISKKHRMYQVVFRAKNKLGKVERDFRIVVGDRIALTPPMGWNSWNCFAHAVSADKVKAAADAMVSSGLVDYGWTYINIDDFWQVQPDSDDPTLQGDARDENGNILPNPRFPDMNGLVDYIHSLGLKAGIYSSPGPLTCGGCIGSYEHEVQDAQKYTQWGFDYLKYDWCSYGQIAEDQSLYELMKPYITMRDALLAQDRDIVYSLCQYGMGNVSAWGDVVGGNCWRTTGDIRDTWDSMADIGFRQNGLEHFAKLGAWNDPDMLVVGQVGWGPNLHPSRLTPNEQYTHISLWSLLAAPLLIGCDMTQLDGFTFNLLTNHEVIDVNQDPLGKQGRRVSKDGPLEVWVKPLEDGSIAVGLFNRGYFAMTVKAKWRDLGVKGRQIVRDLWRQKDLGEFQNQFSAEIPCHGVMFLRLRAAN
ncbi:NPCBM/NEW2 domain-containing protein [Candidatus Sumerlaeota bacterium]|nr:NPCBM/NEW2 domain-containing protein [Candidatus Sumerlaeota bacterium]